MEKIKGLIIKDILQLKTYRRTIVLYIAIFIFSSFSSDGINQVLLMLMAMFFGMFAIASFNYDASSRADKYILSLPLTKKEVVKAKYIFIILATFFGAFLGTALNIVLTYITTKKLINLGMLLNTIFAGLLVIVLVQAFQIPFIYKYGPEKGRLISIMITMSFVSLIVGIFSTPKMTENISEMAEILMPILFFLGTMIIYYISYKVSCIIYSKSEQ